MEDEEGWPLLREELIQSPVDLALMIEVRRRNSNRPGDAPEVRARHAAILTHSTALEPHYPLRLLDHQVAVILEHNDLDGELVNFWRVIQNHPQEFFKCCARMVPSRELFEWERYRDTAGLTDIQRASRYYYLQRLAFGGQMRNLNFGTSSIRPPGFHLAELRKSLPEMERRLQRVLIENLDAVKCIRRYDRATTFFYVDPPYWGERKYTLSLESADYDRLARELKQIKGRFLMTLNDCEPIRRIFGGFVIEAAESGYFIANSRRARNARPKGGQLLIHNLKQ